MSGTRRSIESLGTSSTFLHDLGLSASALVAAPLMVVLTMVLAVLAARSGPLGGLGPLAQLVLAGFVGVQRIWFLRVWRKSALELHEIAPLTWRFLGRYVALGAIVGVGFIPFVAVDFTVARNDYGAIVAIGVVFALLFDVLLTFVTPALAYTTRSVRAALRLGLRMLTSTWPQSAWYVVTPGLVLVTAVSFARRSPASLVMTAVVSVIALWFKGAVAAFYLRLHPEIDGFGA